MNGAVDDDRPFASEALQYRRHHHELAAVVDAEELMVELHRIDERADEIEDRRHPQILPDFHDLPELRMHVRCKEEGDVVFLEHHVCVLRAESSATPNSESTSELPVLLVTLLLPCFATVTSAPARTNADAVEILKLCEPSPPVPQLSITLVIVRLIGSAFSLSTPTSAAISSTVSPFAFSAIRNAATSESLTASFRMISIASAISSNSRFLRADNFLR